jgi:hypothetical protein
MAASAPGNGVLGKIEAGCDLRRHVFRDPRHVKADTAAGVEDRCSRGCMLRDHIGDVIEMAARQKAGAVFELRTRIPARCRRMLARRRQIDIAAPGEIEAVAFSAGQPALNEREVSPADRTAE